MVAATDHIFQAASWRASLVAAFVVFVLASTAAGAATASGGLSIAHGPMITPGTTVSENSQIDQTAPGGDALGQGCFNDVEYWRVRLNAGDKVEVTGKQTIAARGFLTAFFAPGTTDKTVARATSVAHGFPAEHVLRFTVKATGVYPIASGPNCYNGTDGPYTFVVSVRHHT